MSIINPDFNTIPPGLREQTRQHWQHWCEVAGERAVTDEKLVAELIQVWAMSDFVAKNCVRDPGLLSGLMDSGDLFNSYSEGHIERALTDWLDGVEDEAQLGERLRRFRLREMVRIAWRDLAGRAKLKEVTADLSALADACIDQALQYLYSWHCDQWGVPYSADGEQQRLVVVGMGKLGARELNFSSDVDLIFSYPEEGETQGGRRSTSNHEFFIRLGQRLINMLDANTAYGFVFRVDMRLRPFGGSGTLAISFDAMEDYYLVHGREWERYALIKARVVAGNLVAGEELMRRLRPFVYRKYVDYGAFESLREMKAMISREVLRKGMDDNVKLGAGGIREIEFIGQAFQLIRGGREPTLQVRPILTVIEVLRGFGMLPDFAVRELTEAYIFLRNTEHRLQEFAEQQTHLLPGDESGRMRLAFSMGAEDWERFEPQLRKHMRRVHEHFERVFAAPQAEHAEADELDLTGVWQGSLDEEPACEALVSTGYHKPTKVLRQLRRLREGRNFINMSSQARSRINRLMPLLLGAVGRSENPDLTLQRLLVLVEGISRRSSYIALLVENPVALSQLARLCSASPWIASQLTRYPQLLDELLDPRTLYSPPSRAEIQGELQQRLLRCDEEDLEQHMEILRHFKQANVLRVAAADIVEAVPLMVVSDHLTDIAEVVLDATLNLAWRYMVKRHGRPLCGGERVCDIGFAIIAYGKLGGIELGYGSDLDIVFLHSTESSGRSTNGEKPLDNTVFYARLAQRMIHILSTHTQSGELYEIDTRLRPSGASGLMVSSVGAFEDYQKERAWTWEHQALVRARVVAGDPAIAEAFDTIRRAVLGQKRDREKLRQEVLEMRDKMRSQLSKDEEGAFDLKQGRGGIADIEFMVQYAVLAWACDYPALLDYTDNIRLLEGLAACSLMPPDDVALLSDAYRAYRARVHRLKLQDLPAIAGEDEFRNYREGVVRIWREWMEKK